MSEDVDDYGGDECGSGSRAYFADYLIPTPKKSHGALIVILIGLIMAGLSLWAFVNDGGQLAAFCFFLGLCILAVGMAEKFIPNNRRHFPL